LLFSACAAYDPVEMEHAVHPVLTSLSPTRRRLLDRLKADGERPANDLAGALGVTTSAVRMHLEALRREGLVTFVERHGGRGRPRRDWRLTAAADALYPRAYADLTNELLSYVETQDPALLERIFTQRRDRRIAAARARLRGKSFDERVTELARILDEDGYLADWSRADDGAFLVTERNCAIVGVAARYGQACGSEMEFIRAVLPGARVERLTHIVSGGLHCTYRIEPRGARGARTVPVGAST
jgi:DeoR family transcriptional regulator, suf operon transcriptional repressor